MEIRKSWFSYLTIAIYLLGTALILIYGIIEFGGAYYYSGFAQAGLIAFIGFAWVFFLVIFKIGTKCHIDQLFDPSKKRGTYIEIFIVTAVLIVGTCLRVWIIRIIPMDMESDFLYYYNIAVALVNDTLEQSGQIDYLAMSPNGFGYPYLLSRIMILFGTTSDTVCYVTMTVAQMLTTFFCYRIARKLNGRVSGLLALVIVAFWPSQILYSDFNGTEAVSTCLLYLGVLLFVHIVNDLDEHANRPIWTYVSHILLGVLLELSAALRPVATIFLIAAVLCLLPSRIKLKYKDYNNVPLCTRFLSKGWLRALVILASYMICTNVVNANIAFTLDRDIGGGGVTYGYSLATGLNRDTAGGYSEEVSQLMKDVYYETGSSAEAGKVMLDRAMETIRDYPIEVLNLFFVKYDTLWANDDYGVSSNIHSLNAQGKLTQAWDDWLSGQKMFHNFYYFTFVVFSAIAAIYLWKEKSNVAQVLVLFFVGAIALHSLIEVQNRYHYYMLQTFAILAAVALGFLYKNCKASVLQVEAEDPDYQITEETYIDDTAEIEADHTKLDLKQAIEEGHIVLTATKASEGVDELAQVSESVNNREENV